MKIVYLFSSYAQKKYICQAWSQKKTFAKTTEQDIFKWIYAIDSKYIYETENSIFTPCSSDNEFIYLKTIKAIEYVIDKYEPDYLIRSNNSSYINVPDVRNHLASINSIDFGFGFKNQDIIKGVGEDFISGTFIAIPLLTARKLVDNFKGILYSHEDIQMSHEISKNGGLLISGERCNINIGEPFTPKMHYRLKHSSSTLVSFRLFYIHLLIRLLEKSSYFFHSINLFSKFFEIFILLLDSNNDRNMKTISLLRVFKIRA